MLILVGTAFPACAARAPVRTTSTPVPAAGAVAAPEAAAPAGTAQSPALAAALGDPDQNTLSQTIHDGLTGLALEEPALRERLQRAARELASLHHAHGAQAIRRAHVQACQGDEPRDAYDAVLCRLWLESAGTRSSHGHRHASLASTRAGRKRLLELERAAQDGRADRLSAVSDAELHETLKKIHSFEKLRLLIENALSDRSCASTALLTGLGLRTEERFPESDYRELAEALYARAAECGSDAAAAKGAYRLGLLQIWDRDYLAAARTLEKLSDNPAADDYRSRVVYWRYFCAKQTADFATRDKMKELLARDYHLTLHGLITVGPKPTDNHPTVAFSSALHPELNPAIRVAEALLQEGDKHTAMQAIEPLTDELSQAEPAFQLYVGLVLMRADDSVHKFKILTGLFRDYPGLISHESLEMLFPLNRFEVVRHYGRTADPFLVISLIRQESAFNEHARSPVGALGLMQLMPRTARRMERVSRNALYNPDVNIRLGVRFFSRLSERYGGEAELALAAYNAGPENVDTWQARYPVSNRLLFVDLIPFRETREYVASIARNYFWYKKLYEEQPPSPETPGHGAGGTAAAADRLVHPPVEKTAFFKLFDS
jgi:soluble lytic murein transglycosylase